MKKLSTTLVLILLVVSNIFAQLNPVNNSSSTLESCGFDQVHKELLNSNAHYKLKTDEFNDLMKSGAFNSLQKAGEVYRIPVVVHVMHKGEAVGTGSNISEEDINQGILQLNERFRKIAGSLGDGNGVDVEIEFALAIRDPNGNCTNGIVRYSMTGESAYMNNGVNRNNSNGIDDGDLKALSRWNTNQYYNIYLVSEIDNNECGFGIQGYAYFASAHGQSYDGMVQLGCKFAQSGNTTLTHELGHALNLYHTFEGDNDGTQCPSNSNCSTVGDRVCDTPPHIRSASDCVAGTNACDGNSSKELFIHNYMDYSSDACQSEFTAGQKTRATAAITVTRASYLESNGNMSLVPPASAGVDFTASNQVVCLGSPVSFYDESTCIPNTYQNGSWSGISFLWTFDNGVDAPITSTNQNPTINFVNAGSYSVTLQVTNGHGTTSLTKPNFVSVTAGVSSSTCQNASSNTGNFGYTISSVKFNEINGSSSSSTNGGWQDFTCTKNTQVTEGQSYDLDITVNSGNSGLGLAFRVYIDYNNDGAYAAGELVLSNSIADNVSQTFSTSVQIPLTATTGQLLRLRAIADAGTLSGGCETPLLAGDVEDYGVYINPVEVAPVADFSGTPTTLCVGNSVSFSDLSTNTPTSWSWTFTGGTPSSSTAQNPTITYNTPGTYQVQLTATNTGGSDAETKVGYITVNGVPSNAGAITGSVSECDDATAVAYSISTVSGATGYTWTVPAGATVASGQGTTNITVDFGTTSGNVAVTPTNSCGNGGQSSKAVTIAPCGSVPVADFSANATTVCLGESINFSDLSTNSPTSWLWNFGDGGSSSSQNTTYTYNTPGTYTVTLTATNGSGSDDEVKTNLITVNVLDDASFNYSQSSYCQDGLNPTPTILGTQGGTFTRSPAGLVINSSTGMIDLSASPTGTYTITYTTGGVCSDAQNVQVTIVNCGTTSLKPLYAKTYLSYSEIVACYAVTNASEYEFEFVPVGGGSPIIYNRGINNISFLLGWVVGLQDGITYNVRVRAKVGGVFGSYGITKQLTTPTTTSTTSINSKFCGKIYVSYAEQLNAYSVSGATEYEYEFSPIGGGSIVNHVHTSNSILLGSVIGLIDNTNYNVKVRAKVGGVFGSYGSSCQITTPSSSMITSIKTNYCGLIYPSMSSLIACYSIVGAEDYEFEFTPVGGGTALVDTNISTSPSTLLNRIIGIQNSTTYNVRVRARLSGVYQAFGASCQITTPSAAMILDETARFMEDQEVVEEVKTTTLSIYPNPNTGDQINMVMENLTSNSTVMITDIYGKVILNKPLNTDLNQYNLEVKFDGKLSTGFYFVTVISEESRVTEKLIVR